ncbi:MAG: hypothetical protein CMD31_12975 [Flavobacteriales bacterium]|jgi:cell division protein FtsW (lipid II flippase)|nr:hypothetical protein [Flavobacteriales bacterium]|tara:strand:+ start:24807 stop:25244 length:438 start_codon:yes stop_codon:yes gene_type:complete
MDNKYILEGESIITQSNDKTVTVTNKRVRYQASSSGKAHIVSIMLEKISSIEIHYKSKVFILIIGILLAAAGLFMGANNVGSAMILGLVLGGLFILIYLLTRKHVVSIASDGGAIIYFQTKGMKREVLLDFINKIEKAKSEKLSN